MIQTAKIDDRNPPRLPDTLAQAVAIYASESMAVWGMAPTADWVRAPYITHQTRSFRYSRLSTHPLPRVRPLLGGVIRPWSVIPTFRFRGVTCTALISWIFFEMVPTSGHATVYRQVTE